MATDRDLIIEINQRLQGHGERMDRISRRLDRLDALTPAPTPVEPTPAPETPDALATRLLGDPETLAAVLIIMAENANQFDRTSIYDEIIKRYPASYVRAGLRSLAATIAAGSFGK